MKSWIFLQVFSGLNPSFKWPSLTEFLLTFKKKKKLPNRVEESSVTFLTKF